MSDDPILGIPLRDYPAINACFNALSTVFILLGWYFIRHEQKKRHIAMMVSALTASTFFLGGYLIYHFNVSAVTRFDTPGVIRVVYLAVLASHILLAFFVLPLVIMTVIPALRGRFDRHRRIARWALPVWLYVSVTGVLVYLMLYQWFPPASLTQPGTPAL